MGSVFVDLVGDLTAQPVDGKGLPCLRCAQLGIAQRDGRESVGLSNQMVAVRMEVGQKACLLAEALQHLDDQFIGEVR